MSEKDYIRVCDSCGTSWLLPKEWATERAPRAFYVRSLQRSAKFGPRRRRTRYAVQAAAMQGTQDRVLTNGRCPACGSSAFRQYKPGQAPPVR